MRRRGGAVDVVVGENPDIGPGLQRVEHGNNRLVHVHERQGIGEQSLQGRPDKRFQGRRRYPAAGNEPAQRIDDIAFGDVHQGQLLRQLAQGVVADAQAGDPFTPGPAAERFCDAKVGRHIRARFVEGVHGTPIRVWSYIWGTIESFVSRAALIFRHGNPP